MLAFCICIFVVTSSYAQPQISVKSFRKLENDLSARVDAPKKDQNGEISAIIKVVTSQTGFIWEPDGLGIVSAVPKGGEYWLYVPHGAKRITIKHPYLGVMRDYYYTIPIEKATVYEMVLVTGKTITTVEESNDSQWLLISPEPGKAMIYINETFVKIGEYQTKLKPGKYNYRVEAPMYYTEAGKFEISDSKKELYIKLKPAFGFIQINTKPESGATIVIDGKVQSSVSPYKSDQIASGEHSIQILKEMYQPVTQKVLVADGKITDLNIELKSNFVELQITTLVGASVYINNQLKGTSNWKGSLNPGIYSIEVKKESHRSVKQEIELMAGEKKIIDIQPIPIYGSLDIMTIPAGARISIGNIDYGTTPNSIRKLLIGEYKVVLNKQDYDIANKTITIEEGINSEIIETLKKVGESGKPDNNTMSRPIEQDQTIASISDNDGNVYKTVKIGTQIWMAENLKTSKYNDGTNIPLVTDGNSWINLSTSGYCWYNNDIGSKEHLNGGLYNWYTINTGKLCPIGWHVPSDTEWNTLITYLGGESIAGSKLKGLKTNGLVNNNANTAKNTGFGAFSNGYRNSAAGEFNLVKDYCFWWSSTEFTSANSWYTNMYYSSGLISRLKGAKQCGFSVRCLHD